MEDSGNLHMKSERISTYAQPPALHMPAADQSVLHNFQHPPPQAVQMPPTWNPTPSPYQEASDHRPPPSDPPPSHQQPGPYPPNYPAPGQIPPYPPDPSYSRAGSVSGPTRSPQSAQQPHYPQSTNGTHPDPYYQPQDYRARVPYPPPESAVSTPQQPSLHVTTNHDMMSGQTPGQPPPGYPPPPHSAGPHPSNYQWGYPPPYWDQQQRRKPVRAAQACDSCRQRKAKCDEGRPECTHCRENGLKCSYRDIPPQKSEKQVIAIHEKVDTMGDKMDTVLDRISGQDDRINRLAATVESFIAAYTGDGRTATSTDMVKTQSRPRTKEELANQTYPFVGPNSINAPFMYHFNSQSAVPQAAMASDNYSKTRGPMGASDLLVWPGIKELVPQNIKLSFVMDGELDRGLLRLYGCGEGEDKADGHDGAPSPSLSSSSGRMEDDNSTSSPSGVWGTGQFPPRDPNLHAAYDHAGGVTPEGELLLSRKVVDANVKSYLERMHILHPFLDTRVLRKMVHMFKAKYSLDFAINPRLQPSVGSKRKRDTSESPGSLTEESSHHSMPHHGVVRPPFRGPQPIEHSISNAIVLLVIALGKICAFDKPLPGPPKSTNLTSAAKVPQPLLGYPDLPPSSSAPASPFAVIPHTNGMSSNTAVSHYQGKNMDVMPGLAYFAKAADILGELAGGVDVSHIQANLLAGLYMGQLARIIPSHWYIASACKACQILISSADYKEHKMTPERRNLINFAFWSCLQLESDILAEMDIPSSGIMSKESSMVGEVPTTLTITDPEEDSSRQDIYVRHYSNQIQLRRTLNDAVNNVYNNNRDLGKHPTKLIETISENLEMWRNLLKDWNWDDDDHESEDINHARMRGKYYGAKYIINRPALHFALSQSHSSSRGLLGRPSESPVSAGHELPENTSFNSSLGRRTHDSMRPPHRGQEQPLEDWIVKACERCIQAAIKSTTSFDRAPRRLVITNILGTAHAQFGNVLCLAATFNSPNPQLSRLVKEDTLRTLLVRTIKFLDDKAPISPALARDATILRYVQSRIFPSTLPASAATSFSSNH